MAEPYDIDAMLARMRETASSAEPHTEYGMMRVRDGAFTWKTYDQDTDSWLPWTKEWAEMTVEAFNKPNPGAYTLWSRQPGPNKWKQEP